MIERPRRSHHESSFAPSNSRTMSLFQGSIYVNGIPMSEIRDWYIANTGYVLQLARPFYEELTVRDNLTLAAQIKLPESNELTFKDKLKRVEQVMQVVSHVTRVCGHVTSMCGDVE